MGLQRRRHRRCSNHLGQGNSGVRPGSFAKLLSRSQGVACRARCGASPTVPLPEPSWDPSNQAIAPSKTERWTVGCTWIGALGTLTSLFVDMVPATNGRAGEPATNVKLSKDADYKVRKHAQPIFETIVLCRGCCYQFAPPGAPQDAGSGHVPLLQRGSKASEDGRPAEKRPGG